MVDDFSSFIILDLVFCFTYIKILQRQIRYNDGKEKKKKKDKPMLSCLVTIKAVTINRVNTHPHLLVYQTYIKIVYVLNCPWCASESVCECVCE